jgi:hypothetical protein
MMNTIKRDTNGQDDLTTDHVWDLLRKSPSAVADPSFADRVLRAVRQQEKPQFLWQRLFAPPVRSYSLAGLGAVAAVLAVAAVFLVKPPVDSGIANSNVPTIDAFADLDEVASQEMLSAATDHLNEFSDTELVSLIGF